MLLSALLTLFALTSATPAPAGAGMVRLAVAGRANATPSVTSAGPTVVVAWAASLPSGVTDIFTAVSRDSGATFGPPVRVNNTEGNARSSGEQPPRVAIVPSSTPAALPEIVVVWTAKAKEGTDILQAKSTDLGRTYGATQPVPGGAAEGNRGWHNVTVDAKGRVSVVWLDHRAMAGGEAMAAMHMQGGGQTKADGVAMAQLSQLYVASLADRSPRSITGGVCYCCKTAFATGPDGTEYVAWRHVYAGNVRDIAFTSSKDEGRKWLPPTRVSDDKWVLDGCPDDGPAVTVDRGGTVHVLWPTLVDDGGAPTIALFYATSTDGRTFTARQRLPVEGMPHHPQVAIDTRQRVMFAWDEIVKGGSRRAVVASLVRRLGDTVTLERSAATGTDVGIYPSIAPIDTGVVAAWTSGVGDGAVIRVARVPASGLAMRVSGS